MDTLMNESKKISKVRKKCVHFIEVCMSPQDPNTVFSQSELCGVTVLFIDMLEKKAYISL
jgi:hypothetical protein